MTEPPDYPYATDVDVRFPPLSKVDVPALVFACAGRWCNQTLCIVNESVVRLGSMQGEPAVRAAVPPVLGDGVYAPLPGLATARMGERC